MSRKPTSKGTRRQPKAVLRLPDLDQAKSAVLVAGLYCLSGCLRPSKETEIRILPFTSFQPHLYHLESRLFT